MLDAGGLKGKTPLLGRKMKKSEKMGTAGKKSWLNSTKNKIIFGGLPAFVQVLGSDPGSRPTDFRVKITQKNAFFRFFKF